MMSRFPLVSIVTPSLNQGRFIRTAINSVLAQDYPAVEHLVVDGGSNDETLDILNSYGDRVRWVSEKDSGQSDALNKGFRRTRGEILTWLNADDVLGDDAVAKVVEVFGRRPSVGLVYGQGSILDETGTVVGPFSGIETFSLWRLLYFLDYILQPAAFFRRSAFETVGRLDESLHYGMDWDLWIRLAAVVDVHYHEEVLAGAREYEETKTATGGLGRCRELGRLTRRHTGTFWTPGVKLYTIDALRRMLGRRLPSGLRRGIDRAAALAMHRLSIDLPAYADGWLGPRGKVVVPRRWESARLELEVCLPQRREPKILIEVPGGEMRSLKVEAPGIIGLRLDLPSGDEPFVEISVTSNFTLRTPQDPRRLAVRVVGLRPASPDDRT